jgi:hypothetical protein
MLYKRFFSMLGNIKNYEFINSHCGDTGIFINFVFENQLLIGEGLTVQIQLS